MSYLNHEPTFLFPVGWMKVNTSHHYGKDILDIVVHAAFLEKTDLAVIKEQAKLAFAMWADEVKPFATVRNCELRVKMLTKDNLADYNRNASGFLRYDDSYHFNGSELV